MARNKENLNVEVLMKKLWREQKKQLHMMSGDTMQKYIWQAGYSYAVLQIKSLLNKKR